MFSGWNNDKSLQDFHAFLIHRLESSTRLTGHSGHRINLHVERPTAYIHIVQANDDRAERISSVVRDAFGVGLIINWSSASAQFHLGDEPERTAKKDRVSSDYTRELSALPELDNAGDGLRSFVSCLLALECGSQPLLIIDEPEAFLAPPQIRRLGRLLATSARERRRQVVVATHSSDLIQGALSSGADVAVCRVIRVGNLNHGRILDSGRLRELIRKPLLRSAAAIDGVFHHGVIACEGGSDCRFYRALLDRLEAKKQIEGPLDLYFVSGGGKGGYTSLGVPVAVIADFDLLENEDDLRKVVTSLGRDYPAIKKTANEVRTAFGSLPTSIEYKQFVADLGQLLQDARKAGKIEPEQRNRLDSLRRGTADWSEAKKHGLLRLSGGQLTKAKEFCAQLAAWGLFLVPKGVLERWWPEGPSGDDKKTKWFVEAISGSTAFRTCSPTRRSSPRKWPLASGRRRRSTSQSGWASDRVSFAKVDRVRLLACEIWAVGTAPVGQALEQDHISDGRNRRFHHRITASRSGLAVRWTNYRRPTDHLLSRRW